MKFHKHAVAAGMILLTGLPVLLAESAQTELPRGLAAIEGQVPERITGNRLLWSGPVSGLKIRGDLPDLGIQLDRRIYDSLDLTAQALRGKVLHFLHGRSHDEVNFQPVRGVHPWLAITSDRFFVPHRLVTEVIK